MLSSEHVLSSQLALTAAGMAEIIICDAQFCGKKLPSIRGIYVIDSWGHIFSSNSISEGKLHQQQSSSVFVVLGGTILIEGGP